jgi:hypothetical protein
MISLRPHRDIKHGEGSGPGDFRRLKRDAWRIKPRIIVVENYE